MRNKLQRLIVAAVVAMTPVVSYAQADIHFSQFYETSILRNPALTGIFSTDYKVGVFYRSQWSSISNPYVTTLGYGEVRVPVGKRSSDFISFGLLGYSDKAGSIDQRITSFYPAINYSKSINPETNTFFSMGVTGGYTQYSFDPSKATFNNQFLGGSFNAANPSLENITSNKMTMWDLGAGINYNTSAGPNNSVTYILGLSAYHLTQPKFTYYPKEDVPEYMRFNGNAAVAFDVTSEVTAQLHLNYAQQGTYSEKVIGGLFTYAQSTLTSKPIYALTFGLLYRYQDAIIPVFKLKYRNSGIGISYDMNVSTLKEASNLRGGMEITVFVAGDFHDKNAILKKTVCPKF